jgi:hypothetical protein
MTLPRFIALCGHPKAGKSLVQEILREHYDVEPVDDGAVLREFAVKQLGLTWDDVRTQEGKLRHTSILDKHWQHRDLLGTLGKQLEDMFGEHIMPYIAARRCAPHTHYSFGSVRKTQGHFFKQEGGVVIGVRNPLAQASGYDFDQFDESIIDYWINNDALALGLTGEAAVADLTMKVHHMVGFISQGLAA